MKKYIRALSVKRPIALVKTAALLAAALFLSGCKLQITVPEGGKVVSTSGTYNCAAGTVCTIDVLDLMFDETFEALSDEGYTFTGWLKVNQGFCGGKASACRLHTTAFGDYPALMTALTDENTVTYLQPVFEATAIPVPTPIPTNATERYEYTLFSPMRSTSTYLIDEQGNAVHTWASEYTGLSVYLLDNGELLRPGGIGDKPSTFSGRTGGSAGVIEILDWESNAIWSADVATEDYLSHHDVAQLPNGNILTIVWEAISADEALALGRSSLSDDTLWADAIYEICRSSESNHCTDGEIVWAWSVWDHVVQDTDRSITSTYVSNVSNVSKHTDKIDLNFFTGQGSSDWTHINSVDYNADTDEILVSVRSFNEYWIIDHGDSNQGIVSRVGNPSAYGGTGEQTLFVQHDAQWIDEGLPGAGNILVFNNGFGRPEGDYSSVDEFCYDGDDCTPGEMISSYSEGVSGDFYADHISGAQRLENGNTLVCEGTEGRLFEYNNSHEIVWEYNHGSEIFRATRYYSDYSGLTEWETRSGEKFPAYTSGVSPSIF
ncbi:MAG: hypothetical protein HOC23_13875 [Halieaceae bacterium]|nr:hypothetical protein [Halieaceae bacterium]